MARVATRASSTATVARTFQSAGGRNFPVPSTAAHSQKGEEKIALTSRLENLLYAELDAALEARQLTDFWLVVPAGARYARANPDSEKRGKLWT